MRKVQFLPMPKGRASLQKFREVMNIVSLKDDPLLKVTTKIVKMQWTLERQWKSSYADLDLYDVYDSEKNLVYKGISFEKLIKLFG